MSPDSKVAKRGSKRRAVAMLKEDVILYSYWRSSCSWRVRIALAMKKVEYTYKAVHLVKSEQMAVDYITKNPMQEVPTLQVGAHTLTQSLPIIEWLDEVYDGPKLLPDDPMDRQKVRSLACMIACDIQPVQNLRVLRKRGMEHKMEWGCHFITLGFEALEKALAETAGTCCFGDIVTLADLCLVPQVYNAGRFDVPMERFPTIQRIHAHLESLDAFKAAHPSRQPDAQ